MKKISLAIVASLFLGLLLGAMHISLATNHIIQDKIYKFNNFISVFDASREKLSIVSKSIKNNLSLIADESFANESNKDILSLYNTNTINLSDTIVLQTIADLYNNYPHLINKEYVNAVSYLSLSNNTLFYRIEPNNYSTFSNTIPCGTSDYCALLYYNSKLANGTYTYDVLEDPSGNASFTLSMPISKGNKNLGSLIYDIPIDDMFSENTFIRKEYENGKNIYSFSNSDLPILQYQGDFRIDANNVIRIKVSYVKIWTSKSYIFAQYSAFVFFILYLVFKKIELDRLTKNIIAGKESFYHSQFNKLHEDIAVYDYTITESRHLKDVIKANSENALILIKYNLDEAKEHNIIPMAHAHMVEIIGSFIRSTDYLIRDTDKEDELVVLLPRCSTTNATKVYNKIAYQLGAETYSDKNLKLQAVKIISNIQNSDNVDDILEIDRNEILKGSDED